ncbi:MAG: ABC transporter permease [Bacteroidaceae bacterium]|nr:ABC transporter permease [Bacteroidaceae bacterium]
MMRKVFEKIYLGIILIFMYAPIVTLIILSFNSSKSRAKWGGFTLKWYTRLFSDQAVASALVNTLSIAVLATIFSTIIGTITCIAMIGLNSKLRSVIMGITNIPMINADIVTGISLMLLFRFLHIGSGFTTILLAHITFNIPFVMLSVMPRVKSLNFYVYEAALDLGATPLYAFRKTMLPDIMPGVVSGALMAFTMSLDDFIITYFTKGSGFETLSTLIYNEVKRGIQPEIYALSAIIFVVVLSLLMIIYRSPNNKTKEK